MGRFREVGSAAGALWDCPPPRESTYRAWEGDPYVADLRRFREEQFQRLPDKFRAPMAGQYKRRFHSEGVAAANTALLDAVESLEGGAWRVAASDEELRAWAARRAGEAARMAGRAGEAAAYLWCVEFVARHGVQPPKVDGKKITEAGAVERVKCPLWWRRQVRKIHGRRVEKTAISIGIVHRRAGLYASDETVKRRGEQRARNRRLLESCLAVNELGQEYTLAQLADLSVSNPTIKRGELMTRMAGFEMVADHLGHVGEFYTWTCPSRMHARHSASGDENENFDGTTPGQAQRYLCGQWAKVRTAFRRAGVAPYGFRVCEPHHDGTPHWHMLLFMPAADRDAVRAILSKYALAVDGDEPGAKKHRFTVVEIDKRRGTAAGYLAKYVAKNIDAFGVGDVDEDLTGQRNPAECARRVDAWASCWGIRQFQQVGGPPVTVWRELRRIRDEQPEPLESVRYNADIGHWCGYVEKMGGPVAPRAARPVRLAKMHSDKPGRYGEAVGDKVLGVECGALVVVTRVHEWRVGRAKVGDMQLGVESRSFRVGGVVELAAAGVPSSDGVRPFDGEVLPLMMSDKGTARAERVFSSLRAASAPWSSVNNCTGGSDEGKGNGFKNGGGERKAFAVATEGGGGGSVDRRGGGNFGRYGGRGGDAAGEGPTIGGGEEWPMTP